jgi:Flp pilus assembly protein TadD
MITTAETWALARRCAQTGNWPQAEQLCRRLVQAEPDHADAWFLLGAAWLAQGRVAEAQAGLEQAVRLKPDHARAHDCLGIVLARQGKLQEATACFRQAVQLRPDLAEPHSNLGAVLAEQRRLDEAVASYRQALRLRPHYGEALHNLGYALVEQGRLEEALEVCRQALALKPHAAEEHDNLGIVLLEFGQVEEATCHFQEALRLKPDFVQAHNNLGSALVKHGRFPEAHGCFERALALDPAHAEAHLNRALLWLLEGDFARGWTEYEWRWRKMPPRSLPRPVWDGSSLAGRTILLHAEQGLGDTLHFIRYAPLVKERGATVVAECPPALLPLLASCPGIDRLVARGAALPDFDCHAPLMSLPRLLGTSLATVPANVPYLFAAAELRERWRQELAASPGFKVGISWHGSPEYRGGRQRAIPLVHFVPLARVEGVRLFGLQKGAGREELPALADRLALTDLGPRLDETTGAFMDTAAVLINLDLVITSDTAIAHLAGALGVPVWLALSASPNFRWLLQREDSPWYPSMRLFRQTRPGDWGEVFERIRAALADRSGPQR